METLAEPGPEGEGHTAYHILLEVIITGPNLGYPQILFSHGI